MMLSFLLAGGILRGDLLAGAGALGVVLDDVELQVHHGAFPTAVAGGSSVSALSAPRKIQCPRKAVGARIGLGCDSVGKAIVFVI